MANFRLEEIQDPVVRENFQRLADQLDAQAFLKGEFRHVDIDFTKAVTNQKIPHYLGFVPRDVVQSWLTGAGTVTWNYALFDRDYLNVTTTAACRVRAFVGRYEEAK